MDSTTATEVTTIKAYHGRHLIYIGKQDEWGVDPVHDYIKERTMRMAVCIVETRQTVRSIAKLFGVSKSTVHKDLTERLPDISEQLAEQVKEILEYHKAIRHLRGGEATKLKYQQKEGISFVASNTDEYGFMSEL